MYRTFKHEKLYKLMTQQNLSYKEVEKLLGVDVKTLESLVENNGPKNPLRSYKEPDLQLLFNKPYGYFTHIKYPTLIRILDTVEKKEDKLIYKYQKYKIRYKDEYKDLFKIKDKQDFLDKNEIKNYSEKYIWDNFFIKIISSNSKFLPKDIPVLFVKYSLNHLQKVNKEQQKPILYHYQHGIVHFKLEQNNLYIWEHKIKDEYHKNKISLDPTEIVGIAKTIYL